MHALYSIGYATKPLEEFLRQLQQHRIDAIADVRSVPYSRAFHDYHRESLAKRLREAGIAYVYLGEELGPRSKDPRTTTSTVKCNSAACKQRRFSSAVSSEYLTA